MDPIKNTPQNTNKIKDPNPNLNKPAVSDQVRQSHEGYVSYVMKMIQIAASGVRGSVVHIVNYLFGWVFRSEKPNPKLQPQKRLHEEETKDPKLLKRKTFAELKMNFEKQEAKQQNNVVNPEIEPQEKKLDNQERNMQTNPTKIELKRPTISESSNVQSVQKINDLQQPVFGRTNSIHKVVPLVPPRPPRAIIKKALEKINSNMTDEQVEIKSVIDKYITRLSKQDAKKQEGIFRECGESTKVESLVAHISSGGKIPDSATVNQVAGAFKTYIRENIRKFEPKDLVKIAKSENRIELWIDLLKEIDCGDRLILQSIMQFLACEIVPNCESNQMNARNLGVTLGLNFAEDVLNMVDATYVNKAIEILIANYKEIFIR